MPSQAVNLLASLLIDCLWPAEASRYSWHFFRAGLATRLQGAFGASCPARFRRRFYRKCRVAVVRGNGAAAAELRDPHLGIARNLVLELLKDLPQARQLLAAPHDLFLDDVVHVLLRGLALDNKARTQDDVHELAILAVNADDGGEQGRLPSACAVREELPPGASLSNAKSGERL
eukprot:2158158-Pleurochrysis_carterae.AAC.1